MLYYKYLKSSSFTPYIIPTRPTSALCDCSFSSLRRLKTYMRSNVGQEKLNSLILTTCLTDKLNVIDNKKIAEKYCKE